MPVTVVVSFEVEEFTKFKAGFDSGQSRREQAGLHANVYQVVGNPNEAFVIGTTPSIEAFGAFFGDPAQQERMRNSGVTSPPDITFLEG